MRNPYYSGTEEWHAYESGKADVHARIAAGHACGPDINEDHLRMMGDAYMAGVRAARTGQEPTDDVA